MLKNNVTNRPVRPDITVHERKNRQENIIL